MAELTAHSLFYNEDIKVVAHNDYIMCIHPDNMNTNSMKLFRLIIAQCRMEDDEFYTYKVNIPDLAKFLQIDRSDLYRDLQEMCKNIMQMLLCYLLDDTGRKRRYKHIFETCEYDMDKEVLYVRLHEEMTSLFLKLTPEGGNFTRIPMIAMMLMKSRYSIRLYELICYRIMSQWPYANVCTTVVLPLEEMRKYLVRTQKSYDRISNFKARILEPSLKEIERCSNWKIIKHDIRDGRTITAFKLEIWDANGYQIVQDCIKKGIPIPQPKF